ncbi:hypothetical protein AAB50_002800 [Salmonella enterica subsp. enterica]|nr:hypothetical protein [Salmonella enterica subsp. enterica]
MLPEHLVSSHFRLSSPPPEATENSKNLPKGKTKLSELQAEGDIDAQTLSKILADKTAMINEKGNAIWLNLITRETNMPLFYSLEDKDERS